MALNSNREGNGRTFALDGSLRMMMHGIKKGWAKGWIYGQLIGSLVLVNRRAAVKICTILISDLSTVNHWNGDRLDLLVWVLLFGKQIPLNLCCRLVLTSVVRTT